jgi:hypothetical protein
MVSLSPSRQMLLELHKIDHDCFQILSISSFAVILPFTAPGQCKNVLK